MIDKRNGEKPIPVQQAEEEWEMECLNDEDISIEMLDERVEFASLVPDGCIVQVNRTLKTTSTLHPISTVKPT